MPTQNVNLTIKLETFVKEQVSAGYFNNASEVHRAALSAMAKLHEEREMRLEHLRQEIQKGIDAADQGAFSTKTIDEIKAQARQRFEESQLCHNTD